MWELQGYALKSRSCLILLCFEMRTVASPPAGPRGLWLRRDSCESGVYTFHRWPDSGCTTSPVRNPPSLERTTAPPFQRRVGQVSLKIRPARPWNARRVGWKWAGSWGPMGGLALTPLYGALGFVWCGAAGGHVRKPLSHHLMREDNEGG